MQAFILAAALGLILTLALPLSSFAGTLKNMDRQVYTYAVHWDDLEPAARGEIKPNETVVLRNATGYIELVNKRDSIYMRYDEAILIQGAILRSPTHPIED
ncbi:hypothetical protein [Megalodesulfovibrio gigas]|uniref:Uncharacterized protein n=1 Tax=Megalodesulfovibrio gigas (strain ATCC 19364 / DSM 1382 / NCIMB 9332 / VKM B-1759) TaxID=1121448 RepID=T2G754_MEGG1|nr:hypothetical protein [Megalodesulfovibrio gigas]AGW12024.1 hypothetical protein DGI_0086 [Megalodesulfovibrio gigas DSM 1382 = ATCC 19364]